MTTLPLSAGPAALLPSWHQLAGAGGLALALVLCLCLGALALGRDSEPEVQLMSGWGVLCLVLTAWGVAAGANLLVPLLALAALALLAVCVPRLRQRIAPLHGAGAVLALTIPLWLVVLPMGPSQPDTWLNLLPNAAYLFDHGRFPAAGAPPSFSFLPGAPYDTQFVAFGASAFSGSFAQDAMGLFNVALACLAGMTIARRLPGWGEARDRPLAAWGSAALGLLLAVPLNPGFVPRYCIAPYGEWPLAVAAMLAGMLGVRLIEAVRAGRAVRAPAIGLALVFAAQVNTKQSGIGLVLAIGVAVAAAGSRDLRGARRALLLAPLIPAIALYAVWQLYVARSGATQLVVEPLSTWNVGLLPQIVLAAAHEAFKHFALFALFASVAAGAVARRHARDAASLLLVVAAVAILLNNAYIFVSYVVHSDPIGAAHAHSFFRYNTQLSLLAMLALVSWLAPAIAARLARARALTRRRLQWGAVIAVLAAPLALWPMLRFDLDAPQPTLAALARQVKADLSPADSRLAMVLPGDRDDTLGSLLRGQILFMPPRRPVASFGSYLLPAGDALQLAARDGFRRLLLTCAPAALTGTQAPAAALIERASGTWHLIAAWRYPPELARRHFDSLIPRAALCAGP